MYEKRIKRQLKHEKNKINTEWSKNSYRKQGTLILQHDALSKKIPNLLEAS